MYMNTTKTKMLPTNTADTILDTAEDFKSAGLVVSLIANLFLFIAWLVIETTDVFNAQIISYLQK